jgi:hypothetical protein
VNLAISGRGFQNVLSRSFVGGVFTSISALEVTTAQVFYFRAVVTSGAEMKMKEKTPPTKLLDETLWNPRPEIDLAPRADTHRSNEFLTPLFNYYATKIENNLFSRHLKKLLVPP